MRVFADELYGIPPEQVIGTVGGVEYGLVDGVPTLTKGRSVAFVDDGPGKPVGTWRSIGRRPIFAFGDSDGDLQMLEWTAAGDRRRFAAIVHQTDPAREWAYDRTSRIGRLDKALDATTAEGWIVVDMRRDWKTIFPDE